METQVWLPITEYAGKYRVSISTLRRRIKSGEVEYSFQEGKYLIKDSPIPKTAANVSVPSQATASATVAPPQQANGGSVDRATEEEGEQPILATANRLLNELKKAYSLILQEKEQQIFTLKEEVTDLRTLVRVLESENERLKKGTVIEPWID